MIGADVVDQLLDTHILLDGLQTDLVKLLLKNDNNENIVPVVALGWINRKQEKLTKQHIEKTLSE